MRRSTTTAVNPAWRRLRKLLDPLTFRLSDSELEQTDADTWRASVGLPDAGNENMGERL